MVGAGASQRPWLSPRALCAAVILLGHLPLLMVHLRNLWDRPHYQFFPLVLVACGVLFWRRWPREAGEISRGRSRLAVLLLAGSGVLLAGGVLLHSPWLGAVAAIIAVGGLLVGAVPQRDTTGLLGVWALLWLLIPPPLGLDRSLIQFLQGIASAGSSHLLDLAGLEHLMLGNVLLFPRKSFLVDEACSGIHSLFSLVACTAVFVVWFRRGLVRGGLLLGVAVLAAVALNVARIASVAVAYDAAGWNLTAGWAHTLVGLGLFAVALGLILSTDQLLSVVLGPIDFAPETVTEKSPQPTLNPLAQFWNRFVAGWPLGMSPASAGTAGGDPAEGRAELSGRTPVGLRFWAGGFALMGIVQVALLLPGLSRSVFAETEQSHRPATREALPPGLLPAEWAGWHRIGFSTGNEQQESRFTSNSHIWTYRSPHGRTLCSVDFPYRDWHELTTCYTGHGWDLIRRRVVEVEAPDTEAAAMAVEVDLRDNTGNYACLLFGCLDSEGRPLSPRVSGRLAQRLRKLPAASVLAGLWNDRAPRTYQVQLLCRAGATPLSRQERTRLRERFAAFRERVRRVLGTPENGS